MAEETVTSTSDGPVAKLPTPAERALLVGAKLRHAVQGRLGRARAADLEHHLSSYEKALSGALDSIRADPARGAERVATLTRFLSSWRRGFLAWAATLPPNKPGEGEPVDAVALGAVLDDAAREARAALAS